MEEFQGVSAALQEASGPFQGLSGTREGTQRVPRGNWTFQERSERGTWRYQGVLECLGDTGKYLKVPRAFQGVSRALHGISWA